MPRGPAYTESAGLTGDNGVTADTQRKELAEHQVARRCRNSGLGMVARPWRSSVGHQPVLWSLQTAVAWQPVRQGPADSVRERSSAGGRSESAVQPERGKRRTGRVVFLTKAQRLSRISSTSPTSRSGSASGCRSQKLMLSLSAAQRPNSSWRNWADSSSDPDLHGTRISAGQRVPEEVRSKRAAQSAVLTNAPATALGVRPRSNADSHATAMSPYTNEVNCRPAFTGESLPAKCPSRRAESARAKRPCRLSMADLGRRVSLPAQASSHVSPCPFLPPGAAAIATRKCDGRD